jgi:quercetin dioxygenase-like cupin family protein
MKIRHALDIREEPVTMEDAEGARMRMLIGPDDGAPNFAMRMFTVDPGGHTPLHRHNFEHEVYVLEGEGVLQAAEREHRFRAGDVIYVAPNELHQFRNTGGQPLRFLCLIPISFRCD